MSRRGERGRRSERERAQSARGPAPAGGGPEPSGAWAPGPTAPDRRPPRTSFLAQAGILLAVFAVTSAIAELAGAANLGVALGVGQVCFCIALVVVIVKT